MNSLVNSIHNADFLLLVFVSTTYTLEEDPIFSMSSTDYGDESKKVINKHRQIKMDILYCT
jgi:hypothetical protein